MDKQQSVKIEIIRSDRKTMSLEVTRDSKIIVRAPQNLPDSVIRNFINEKASWIQKSLKKARDRQESCANVEKLTMKELEELADQAMQILPDRIAYYANSMGVTYGRVTVRNQKTRWGSCSAQGNLNFNCLLMLTPPEVCDYVIVHELAHRKEMNHSKAFWQVVASVLPDYQVSRDWLKTHGATIISRMTVL